MTAATMQIKDLITTSGLSGPQITHALKVLGNGNMQQGLIRIAKCFFTGGKSYYIKLGRLQGAIGGAGGAGLIFLIAKIIKDGREKSKHKEEIEAIMDAFNDYQPSKEELVPESHDESFLPNNDIQPTTEA